MVDVAERLKGFDPVHVLKLIGDFLGGPWVTASLDQFKYQVLSQGFGNRLFICELVDVSCDASTTAACDCISPWKETGDTVIPTRVLVRFYGGNVLPRNNPIRTLNETTEALLFLILGRKSLGPQMYGAFEGGRIEQFIPSRNLTVSEFASCDLVNRAIAAIVAKYHSLKHLPFRKTPWDFPAILRASYAKYTGNVSNGTVDRLIDAPLREKLKNFLHFDVTAEIAWIERVLERINLRVVFTHNDINRSNILLKNNSGEEELSTELNEEKKNESSSHATAASEHLSQVTSVQQSAGNNNNQCSNYDHRSGLLEQNKSPSNETITSEQLTCKKRGEGEWSKEKETATSIIGSEEGEEKSHLIDKKWNSDAHSFEHMVDRLLLVDYEFSGYNYRGVDIGNHFGMKVFDFGTNCFITGLPYPSEQSRRSFIASYMKEVRNLGAFDDWDEEGIDSEEHILMEAEFGFLLRRLTNISGTLGGLETWIPIAAKRSKLDPSFKDGRVFSAFVTSYVERKAAFLKQWPQFTFQS